MMGALTVICKQYLSRIVGVMVVLILSVALFALVGDFIRLGINVSNSLPGTLVAIVKHGQFSKGDVIAFHPPTSQIHQGSDILIKEIVGMPGDIVWQQDNIYFINDEQVGFAFGKTRKDIILHPSPEGAIPAQHYFVSTQHPYSFDSRYAEVGWVSLDQIIGRVVTLW